MGYLTLGRKHYEETTGKKEHADYLIERILPRDGIPDFACYDTIRFGMNVREQFKNDLQLELSVVVAHNNAVDLCARINDNGSRELMESILEEFGEPTNSSARNGWFGSSRYTFLSGTIRRLRRKHSWPPSSPRKWKLLSCHGGLASSSPPGAPGGWRG